MQTEYLDKIWRDVPILRFSDYLHWAQRDELSREHLRPRDYYELLALMEKGEVFNNIRVVKKEQCTYPFISVPDMGISI